MPSMKPECPNCGPISFDDVKYDPVERRANGPGTVNTGSASYVRRRCRRCGADVKF